MARICYEWKRFSGASRELIGQANTILSELRDDEVLSVTLRQLFYGFVSRGWISNTQQSYSRLGSIISDARQAGLIDWDSLVDRTRRLHKLASWSSGADILSACADQFRFDMWAYQPKRVLLMVEKEALGAIFEDICDPLRVPVLCCRGYMSQSTMHQTAEKIVQYWRSGDGQSTTILHFGDHDPSGIDMTRDIRDRLSLYCSGNGVLMDGLDGLNGREAETIDESDPSYGDALQSAAADYGCRVAGGSFTIKRVALNMEQVRQYNPPPNPAKITDSRATDYIARFGESSWELDALPPTVLRDLVLQEVRRVQDPDAWAEWVEREKQERVRLRRTAQRWTADK